MPKKAINRNMINKVQKHLRQGHTPEAIAASYNIEIGVVKAFTEENEAEVRETIREAENVLHIEDKIAKDELDAAKVKRRNTAVKAAATRRANAEKAAEAG
ncbi:MAG: hypothetical protein IIB19_00355 [Chloroflexi bacterium]|nr:hypothetical protein [Chloroflexota bacterium]